MRGKGWGKGLAVTDFEGRVRVACLLRHFSLGAVMRHQMGRCRELKPPDKNSTAYSITGTSISEYGVALVYA
jgi:hypothetical protein